MQVQGHVSGFAAIFNRGGAPASLPILNSIVSRLAHRGPDGKDSLLLGAAALGHRHFRITPEEAGESQPLHDPDRGLALVFDGRLDNRADLLAALGINAEQDASLSDATLVLQAYRQWGETCFERLLGPFALALYDGERRRVVLARDALGDRTLFYHLTPRLLVVASEPYAVLAHPDVPPGLNEITLIHWYAVQVPEDGSTFFSAVQELLPAHAMVIDADRVQQWRYWQADPERRIRYRTDAEYAEHFLLLLAESVRCRMRCTEPPVVLMSGGYDSTSIAALAARELALRPGAPRLRTISWTFDELASCDERPYIEAVARQYEMQPVFIPADDGWPLRDHESWPHNPNHPEGNAYRLLKLRAYRAACEAGSRLLLTGGSGNEIFAGSDYWLLELAQEQGLLRAAGSVLAHIGRRGLRSALRNRGIRRAGGHLLDRIPGGRTLRPRREGDPAPWLTPHAAGVLKDQPAAGPPSAARAVRPEQHHALLDARAAMNASAEMPYASREGVELELPYRDRRLIEFALAIPAYQLQQAGIGKYIVYNAMRSILPEKVRRGQSRGLLTPLYERGLMQRERATVQRLLNRADALWPRYVRREWLAPLFDGQPFNGIEGVRGVVPWQCLAVEMWHAQHAAQDSFEQILVGCPNSMVRSGAI